MDKKSLNLLAQVLKIPLNKINPKEGKFTSKIFELLEASSLDLGPKNDIEKAEILQFIEYILVYATNVDSAQNINSVLKELNGILSLKTFLVGYRLTIVDVLLYCVLWNVMKCLTSIEKENVINVCRWFDNIQHDSKLKSDKLIDFSTTHLAVVAPTRH